MAATFISACTGAEAVAAQTEDAELAAQLAPLAKALAENEEAIISELEQCQGEPAGLDGYYHANRDAVKTVMRPSATLNSILAEFS